ncbi:uncharacterized protein ATC70_012761 [Mucor velutinosus]|uniref:Uncharacterized protein n=1 Tax=Mucor velutinosus TaxID=708070 RepID=A0AAN7D5W9_9FUNG|nr:hypothetical protein ATC70_012761 [Mucor velutinosus]
MSRDAEIQDMHQHEEYPSLTGSSSSSDDDSASTGGDSGFSMGQDEEELKKQETPEITVIDSSSTATMSFFSRFAAIPIIQDGFVGAQNMVKQHAVGQKALDYAETKLQTIISTAQPYYENNKVIVCANHIGNKSLDLIESKFPLIINAPTDKLLVEPIKGHMAQAAHVVNPRIDYIANQFETLMEQYFPAEDEQQHQEEEEKHGMERLMHVVNRLSSRASRKISKKASATMEEELQIKQMIRTWVLEQVRVMTQHQQQQWPQLQEQMESFKAKFKPTIQTMYDFTHYEFDKFRQELFKPNTSHLDRIRNILILSQTDILMPLYQKSYSIWKNNNNVAAAANE